MPSLFRLLIWRGGFSWWYLTPSPSLCFCFGNTSRLRSKFISPKPLQPFQICNFLPTLRYGQRDFTVNNTIISTKHASAIIHKRLMWLSYRNLLGISTTASEVMSDRPSCEGAVSRSHPVHSSRSVFCRTPVDDTERMAHLQVRSSTAMNKIVF